MKRYRVCFFLALIFLTIMVTPTELLWATNEGGGDAWAFMKVGIGARAIGMGGAFVAIADDASAAYWNPAGLGILTKRELTMMGVGSLPKSDDPSASGIGGSHNYLGICYPTKFVNIGISSNFFSIGGIQYTTGTSELDFRRISGQDQRDTELALTNSYGIVLPLASPRESAWIFLGINIRYMQQHFSGFSTNGFGGDVGFIIRIKKEDKLWILGNPLGNFRLGYVFRYNHQRKWNDVTGHQEKIGKDYVDPTTTNWQWGIAWEPTGNLTTALSLINNNKGAPLTLSIGGEYKLPLNLAIRVGIDNWKIQQRNSSDTIWKVIRFQGSRYTVGAGIILPIAQVNAQLDYAFSFEALTSKHQISLTFRY